MNNNRSGPGKSDSVISDIYAAIKDASLDAKLIINSC